MSDFSVLLSVYGGERGDFLRQSLASVFGQTLRPGEVVLVEDGPLTEELYGVVEEFRAAHPELKVVALAENGGLGRALNEGLKHCTHEWVARMDSDDICRPDRFEKQARVLAEHPEYAVVSAWIDEFVDDPGHVVSTRRLPEMPDELYEYGKSRCPVNHPAVMFRKSAVLACGGLRYALTEARLQFLFVGIGYIGLGRFLKNLVSHEYCFDFEALI